MWSRDLVAEVLVGEIIVRVEFYYEEVSELVYR